MVDNVVVRKAGRKGKGVFALKGFKKGELVFRNKIGKIVKKKDLDKLSKEDKKHLGEIDSKTFEIMQPPRVCVNHSCNPNSANKGTSFFALRKIKKGYEITTDYRVTGLFKNKWKCHCGSKNCKGYVISDFFTLPPKLQKRYLPYTIKAIRDQYIQRHSKS